MARIGFIGLGNMGGGMAANLAKHGHIVSAYDLSVEALDRAKQAGCHPVDNVQEAAAGAEAVVTMLPSGTHVEQVYSELYDQLDSGSILIDCSTIDVATAKRVAHIAHDQGLIAVDAPVSGGIVAATAGTLTFMVGGSSQAFTYAETFLAAMGKAVIFAGTNGSGQAAKICNNMLLGAEMAATCEAFLLAQKLGLDPQSFYDIASVSSGQSWSMTSYCPLPGVGPQTPADRDYQGGFAAALMLKDLWLAMEAARQTGAPTPMGMRATELYERYVVEQKQGGTDFSGIIRMLATSDANP